MFAQGNHGIRNNFADPDFEYGPWVFWMWMNGNITKEGITLDLEAMHDIGVSGAVLFTSNAGIPQGKVEYGSREWIDCNKHMFSEAKRLNMQIMLHNGPGYSVTGGPWITPENSMQQLVWSETVVSGNSQGQKIQLPQPYAKMGYYEDAIVIAYPALKGENRPMQSVLKNVKINGTDADKAVLFDFNYDNYLEINIPSKKDKGELVFEFDEPFEASSLVVRRKHTEPPYHPYDGPRDNPPVLTLEYSDDGIRYFPVCKVNMPEMRELDLPTSQNFKSLKAKFYKLSTNKNTQLTELFLYTAPRLEDWANKAGFTAKGNRKEDLSEKNISSEYIIDPAKVFDITRFMLPDGTLDMAIPEGNWTILRFGHTTTGEENAAGPFNATGLECDKLNKKGIQAHYDRFLGNILEEMKEFCGNSFYGITVDSWEAGTQNWTKGFEKEYYLRHQKSIIPYMPAFTGRMVGSTYATERFLAGIRQTCATMLAENYHRELRDICHQHNLCFLNESYGDGPFNSLEAGKYADIPAGEFWAHGLYGGSHTNNQAGYLARIGNKKIAAAEAFTAMPDLSKFTEYPAAMKGEGDWMYCNGINRLMFHTYAHQPHPAAKPGMTMGPFGTHMNRNQTWWKQSKPYMDYLRRCQLILQEGEFISNNSPWVPPGCEDDPTQKKNDFSYFSLDENAMINYIHKRKDGTYYYFIANNKRSPERIMAVFDMNGKQPELWYPETGEQYPVHNYTIENGRTIIPLNLNAAESVFVVFDKTPQQPSVWNDEKDLRQIEKKRQSFSDIYDSFTVSVWLRPDVIAAGGRSYVLYPQNGERLYGKGHATIGLAVGQDGIKIFEQAGDQAEQVLKIEKKIEGWSLINLVYDDGIPIVYLNGERIKQGVKSSYKVHSSGNELSEKDPMITVFQGEYSTPVTKSTVISRKESLQMYKAGKPMDRQIIFQNKIRNIDSDRIIPIDTPWVITFPENTGAPEQITEKELKSLHVHSNAGVRYFSGTATYHTNMRVPENFKEQNDRLILDLGNVAFFAETVINGKSISTSWKAPYMADITDHVIPGENRLEIKVTNLWTNRLIGDEFLPAENEYDKWGESEKLPEWYTDNQPYKGKRNTFVTWKQYDKNGPLTESGLIGPVRIMAVPGFK